MSAIGSPPAAAWSWQLAHCWANSLGPCVFGSFRSSVNAPVGGMPSCRISSQTRRPASCSAAIAFDTFRVGPVLRQRVIRQADQGRQHRHGKATLKAWPIGCLARNGMANTMHTNSPGTMKIGMIPTRRGTSAKLVHADQEPLGPGGAVGVGRIGVGRREQHCAGLRRHASWQANSQNHRQHRQARHRATPRLRGPIAGDCPIRGDCLRVAD